MNLRRPYTVALFFVSLLAFAMGCGDARLTSTGFDPAFEGEGPSGPRPRADAGDGGAGDRDTSIPRDEPFVPPDDELTCILLPMTRGDVFVGVDSNVQLGVYQFDLSGNPMADAQISFGILEEESDARLSAERVRTDTDGFAGVRLNGGSEPGFVTVRVVTSCARSIDIEVEILDLPTGDLNVRFNYPFADVLAVSPVRVDLHPTDTFVCRDRRPGELPAGALRTESAGSTLGSVDFEGVGVDQVLTVVVTAFGPRGERAAQGCVDSVTVREGRTTEITVDLFLLPLDPVGTYDVLSWWDFRDAIADSGPVGALIVQILDIFDNPGRGLYDFILNLVTDFAGGLIGGAIRFFLDITGIASLIQNAINNLIDSSPLLSSIVTIGRDLRAIIAQLEVISVMEIGKLDSTFEVFGVDNWVGLSLYWRLGCTPADPPDCGRIPVILDTVDLGLLRGEWRGRVLGYNRLDIDRHPIDFAYGRLILYVLEYLVLPAITGDPGPVTLADLMARIVNCRGIGEAVGGGPGGCRCALGACVCAADIEGFCRSFIDFTFGGLLRSFVNALSFDAVLDIRGSVSLVNVDEDLSVDQLRGGNYIGNINVGGSVTPFVANFCGVRRGLDVTECVVERP
jgi:hypothetical protein